ncbi:uncharacterized protein LOC123924850 isoform X2 [Trifolium pratense]|nr:uncharacterized protein LOC123924850 isoform X2 [Trifolium pratense]
MLFKTEDEDKHKIECNSQKTSFDDLMRFSCQEINHVSKEGKEKHEAHDHILSGAKKTDYECLVQRVTKLERKFDNIILSINDSSKFDGIIQSINDLKAVVLNNNVGKPEIMENKEVEKTDAMLEKNEMEKKDVILEKNDKDNEPKFDGNLRTFFPPSYKNQASSPALVVNSTPTGCYIIPQKNIGISSTNVERQIPDWLSLLFKPIKAMNLNVEQSAVASYIFGDTTNTNFNKEEVLVVTDIRFCQGTRKLFECLKPQKFVGEDIIDLAVSMFTYAEKKDIFPKFWFLPTTFSQYVQDWNTTTKVMIKKYQAMFMGKVDKISKIFIPIHDPDSMHWFLLVIDLVKKELIYLDSLPSKSAHVRRMRMRCIKKLALYMEDLLLDPSFYTKGTTPNPIVSEFSLVIPKDLGQQANNSNDCAIWVITWMEKMKADVYKIDVDDGTRLRVALNLTMNSYNKLNDEILARSMQQIDKRGKA